jgi:anti-sigma regulatory factor (Ser/Thr protein kinase)
VSWDFPALEAPGDAVVVAEVVDSGAPLDPVGTRSGIELRVVYANRGAERVFELTPASPESFARVGEIDRILAVAATGHPDSWVRRQADTWYEVRAARVAPSDSSGAAGSPPQVLLIARDLGTVTTAPREGTGVARSALLLEISRQLGAAVHEDQVARVLFDLACPALGAEPGRLAVAHRDGEVTVTCPTPSGGVQRSSADPAEDAALLEAIGTPDRLIEPQVAGPAIDWDRTRGQLVTVPLLAGASAVGAIEVRLSSEADLGHGFQDFFDTVAALVAQAVQRARLFDAQREASLALQHALLPPTLPEVDGLELAAKYRAGSGHEVGGDWYDVIPLPSGWVALVIGDVQGHDLSAAALMGQIRSVVRAYLLDELPPTAALSSANAFLLSLDVDRLVTVCIALVHPRSRIVTLATAGHACPLLVTPGRPGELLEIPGGPPLGVLDDVTWRERTTPLPADATLVLYTDGLVERGDRPYAAGEQLLLDRAALLPDLVPDKLADALLAPAGMQTPEPRDGTTWDTAWPPNEDDTALLLLRWRAGAAGPDDEGEGAGAGDHVRSLPVAPASAVIARWYVDDLLRSWRVDTDTRETAVLLTDEIVANAVRHAHRTVRLDVSARRGQVLVEVFDDSHREPRLDGLPSDATSGRGLRLVNALATTWGVQMSQGDLGKTVWFTVSLPS